MTLEHAVLWWNLGILTNKRYEVLKQVYGSLDSALDELSPLMLTELGLKDEAIEKALSKKADFDAPAYIASMERYDVHLLTIEDDLYPVNLQQLPDAPLFLSYKGDISLVDHPMIGIVGTRNMTQYGLRVVEKFVPTFVRAYMITVSGLALGIDAAVADETMKAGGKTVAVLGNGLGTVYPTSHTQLAERILERGGLLLSEFPLLMPPDKYTFPSRNRIIAGLCQGTLVCEAPVGSGSVITAELALDYNRPVFAVPGPIFEPTMEGCHALIKKDQAHLVSVPEDILHHLGMLPPETETLPNYTPQTDTEKIVYAVLTAMPQTVDDIIEKTGCTAPDVISTLMMLHMADAARAIAGGMWIRR
jgi:DNA processing protein